MIERNWSTFGLISAATMHNVCELCRKSLECCTEKFGLYGKLCKLIEGKPFKDQRQIHFIFVHERSILLAEIGIWWHLHQKVDA